MMTRQEQIAVMEGAKQRLDSIVSQRVRFADVRNALRHQDLVTVVTESDDPPAENERKFK